MRTARSSARALSVVDRHLAGCGWGFKRIKAEMIVIWFLR